MHEVWNWKTINSLSVESKIMVLKQCVLFYILIQKAMSTRIISPHALLSSLRILT